MFSNAKEAKDNGWFSRRHQNSTANEQSRFTDRERKERRRLEAEARQAEREARTDLEQLEVLRQRGITSGREFERLKLRTTLVRK